MSRVLYWFASCVVEQLLSYIRDAKTPNGVWENLKKIFAASTTPKKLQLQQELSNLRERDLSVDDYTSKIKDICDSLASIHVNIEQADMVQICLAGLASMSRAFRTAVCTRENTSSFFDLQSMLLVEENHAGASTRMHSDSKMLYTEGDRPLCRCGQGDSVCIGGSRQEQGRRHHGDVDNNFESSGSRGS